ncbi:MAG: THUMP domain-containing protein [Pyrodictiaceae archaeon]
MHELLASSTNNIYYAIVSGQHATLPLAELRSILESYSIPYTILGVHDQTILFTAKKLTFPIANRSGFIHEVGLVLGICDADEQSLLFCIKEVDWCRAIGNNSFKVTLVRLKGYSKHVNDRDLTRTAGAIILGSCNLKPKVDVKRPDRIIEIVLTEGMGIVGLKLEENNVKELMKRRPHLKPFYKPGALDPRLSRLFVNLSRTPPGGLYYDPFCGTGGFAVEALLMGLNTICLELDKKLSEGSLINLMHYSRLKYTYYDVLQGDAVNQPLRNGSVDGIGTDPPYGRSTSTRGRRLTDLLRGFLHEAKRVLKKNRFIAFASPHWLDVDDIVKEAGLVPIEKHYMRVHGSLTRVITIAINK